MRTRAQQSEIDAGKADERSFDNVEPKSKARDRSTAPRTTRKATKRPSSEGPGRHNENLSASAKPRRAKKTASRAPDEQLEEAQRPADAVEEAATAEPPRRSPDRDAHSDDDAAPEEVSLSACKKAVEDQQQVAAEQKRLVKDQRKQRVREREQLHAERRKELPEQADEPAQRATEASQDEAAKYDNEDILSPETIAALQEHARKRKAEAQTQQPEVKAAAKPRQKLKERQAGPLTVRILDEKPVFKPSDGAMAFVRQRLQESVNRSHEMLKPKLKAGRRAKGLSKVKGS